MSGWLSFSLDELDRGDLDCCAGVVCVSGVGQRPTGWLRLRQLDGASRLWLELASPFLPREFGNWVSVLVKVVDPFGLGLEVVGFGQVAVVDGHSEFLKEEW